MVQTSQLWQGRKKGYKVRKHQWRHCNCCDYRTWLFVARNLDWHVKSSSEKGKAGMGNGKIIARQSSKTRKMESMKKPWRTQEKLKVPKEAAMPCKMGTKSTRRSCRTLQARQQNPQKDKGCMHRGSSRIRETAFRIHSVEKSWRSHHGERVQFDKSLQFVWCTNYPDATSDENFGCESSSG